MNGGDSGIAPVDDYAGNDAAQRMKAMLAAVTERERMAR